MGFGDQKRGNGFLATNGIRLLWSEKNWGSRQQWWTKQVTINGYNKLAKCLKKIRRCKVDKRGKTTGENISIVIWTSIVIHLRSYHDVRRNLNYPMQISILHNRHEGDNWIISMMSPFRIRMLYSRGTLCP
jgi:hypothetical protein